MRKYWAFFRASVQNTLIYRGPILIWILSNLVNLVAIIAVWLSVSARDEIGGYTQPELVTYYVVALFLQWVIGWLPFYGVVQEIKKGEIIFSIMRPFSYYGKRFFEDFGWHAVGVWVGFTASLAVGFFFRDFLVLSFTLKTLVLVFPAIILSIFVVFGLSMCLGLTAFWFTEIWALDSVFWITRSLLGGQAIPLSFIPDAFQKIVFLLPFRYTFSFPLEIFFQKLAPRQIVVGYALAVFWAITFHSLYKLMWAKGRRIYTSFGQ